MNSPENNSEIVEKLFRQFADRLYSFATKVWRFSEDEAWDTIYETLFHIGKVYHRYEFLDEKKLTNFVITVFNNRLKNRFRNKKLDPVIIGFDKSIEDHTLIDIETSLGVGEKVVAEALDELESWERILLVQRSFSVSYAEIEKLTNKPEHQLKVYYKRSLAKLEKRVRELLSTEVSDEKQSK